MKNDAALMMRTLGNNVGCLNEGFVQPVVRKWRPMLKGINEPWRRRVTALMLENQAHYFNDIMTEEVRSSVVGSFLKFIFPMVRRTWADTVAPNLVSVQPMTAPIGGVAFYRPRYGSSRGGITAGDEMILKFDRDYTSERINGQLVGTGDAATTVYTGLVKTPVIPATMVVRVNDTAVGSATAGGVIVDAGAGVLAAGSSVNGTTGQLTLVFAAAPATGAIVTVDYEQDMEGNPDVPEIRFDIDITEIRAKPRKIKMLWTPEAEEDLRALWGTDITTELVAGASQEMALEVDREIIEDLADAARAGTNQKTFDAKNTTGVTLEEHLRSMLVPLNQVSGQVNKRTQRGPATWLVTSPDVAALMESTPFWSATQGPGAGVTQMGTLGGKYTVYVDPYFKRDEILVGRQGTNFLDTGYVFAPYVPIQITGTFFDPGDFTLRKGMRTRYAKLLVRPEFYGLVKVLNV